MSFDLVLRFAERGLFCIRLHLTALYTVQHLLNRAHAAVCAQ